MAAIFSHPAQDFFDSTTSTDGLSFDITAENAVDPPAINRFDSLPIETVQHIASYMDPDTELTDSDLCNFRLICRSTLNAVDADNGSFWRRRFLKIFEQSEDCKKGGNQAFKAAYQKRRSCLKNGASFRTGSEKRAKDCLEVLRDCIVDCFSQKTSDNEITYTSTNLEHILKFLLANNLLQIIFEPQVAKLSRFSSRRTITCSPQTPTQLLYTIQVICAPMLLSLEPHIADSHYGFPDSQAAVYSTAQKKPLFGGHYGLDVNMELVLQNINFWKYHMVREVENTLFNAFNELEECDRPRWWNQQLQQGGGRKLGKHWKGSYAYIERGEIEAIRSGRGDSEQIQDYFAGEDNGNEFQDMVLEVRPEGSPATWQPAFEQILRSLTPPAITAKTRAQKRSATPDEVAQFKSLSFHFEGDGQDVQEQFLAEGWLNPLPPQQGIPGWYRMTMMKYFETEYGEIDTDALWAYEGVVLPGGQIVVGRWWSPSGEEEEMYSGPFILWCVDGPNYEDVGADKDEVE